MDLVKEELENSLSGDKKGESGSDDESEQQKPIGDVIKDKEEDEKEKAEENT
jgi:hypothetical protein